MRGAPRAHQHIRVPVLGVHQEGQHFLVLFGGNIGQFLATSRAHHKEDVQHASAQSMGPFDHVRQFLVVHRLGAEMHLKLQAVPFAGFNARDRRFPGPGNAAKRVMFAGIEGVDADAHAHDADLDEFAGEAIIDQHAVGAEDDHEPLSHGVAGNVEDVRPDQGFSPGDDQQAPFIDLGDLVDQPITFFRREFVGPPTGLGRGIQITVVTLQVAAFGEIQGEEVRLEIIDGPAVAGTGPGEENPVTWVPGSSRIGELMTGSDLPIPWPAP